MPLKSELRKRFRKIRKNIADKPDLDKKICKNLIGSDIYADVELILFYAALKDEVNIDFCIRHALSCGKKAALPVCTDKNGNMKYYYINSLNDVKTGSFGIREPDTELCREVTDFTGSLCIVPAISFDRRGYRLGYGKGYYDRFLKNYAYKSVGICYNELIVNKLPADEYDIPVHYIITQDGVL